ncbi:MAG TPA: class I SAM-dependent methyltransferase [Thermoleophilaceae bacterium]
MARPASLHQPSSGSAALARDAYDALAPFYDLFTGAYNHEGWLAGLEAWARAEGLHGREVLDVGCGTGSSFLPLTTRGYHVTGCDISPEMVALARARAGRSAEVLVADMRRLPWMARFDLITCLDDAMNYLLERADLEAALASMWAALRPGGILIFDTNSLRTYREVFTATFDRIAGSARFRWYGLADADVDAGSICEACLEVAGVVPVVTTHHVQRHWPVSDLREAAVGAGFNQLAFRGQLTGGRLVGEPDEMRDDKVVCLARKDAAPSGFSARLGRTRPQRAQRALRVVTSSLSSADRQPRSHVVNTVASQTSDHAIGGENQ